MVKVILPSKQFHQPPTTHHPWKRPAVMVKWFVIFVVNSSPLYLVVQRMGFSSLGSVGKGLKTGNDGHLTVEHVPMLFRILHTLQDLLNQGCESSHKLQRQLYSRATSHGASGKISSCKI